MNIITPPDIWLHCQLSIARFTGAIRVNGKDYLVDYASECLVRADFAKYVSALGIETVGKAVERFSGADKAKKVLHRLSRIVNAYKRPKRRIMKDFDGQVREWEIWP